MPALCPVWPFVLTNYYNVAWHHGHLIFPEADFLSLICMDTTGKAAGTVKIVLESRHYQRKHSPAKLASSSFGALKYSSKVVRVFSASLEYSPASWGFRLSGYT